MKRTKQLVATVLAACTMLTAVPVYAEEASENLFEEEVKLVYVLPTTKDMNIDGITEAVNQITKEKINTIIEFQLIPLAEFQQKMNLKYTSGEAWDVCHAGAWNPFSTAVGMGAFAEIPKETLETYAPEYYANIPESIWEAVTVDGKIYGCPIEQQWARQTCMVVNTDMAEKYGFDYTQATSLDDFDEFLAALKENEPEVAPIHSLTAHIDLYASYFGWDYLSSYQVPGIIYGLSDSTEVVNQFATEEFMSFCKKMREWKEAGYIAADAVTGGDSVINKEWGLAPDVFTPGRKYTYSESRGYNVDLQPIGEGGPLKTVCVQEHLQVVSSTCENVERAVAFINLLNTDKELLNTICHGVEGVDWQFTDEANGVIEKLTDSFEYSFFVGNTFNEYYVDENQVGAADEMKNLNAAASASNVLGFTFNMEPVSTQVAQCIAVTEEYLPGLFAGAVDPEETIPKFLEALETAEVDIVLAEMQSQVDAWLASK